MHETITVRGLSDSENATLNRLLKQLDDRMLWNQTRDAYYEMRRTVRQVGSVVPAQYYNLGLTLGWCAKGVDGLRSRCNVRGYSWQDGDLASLGLAEFVDANRLTSEIPAGLTASLVHGPAFAVNTTGVDGEPAALLHVRSAMEATGDYNQRTRDMDSLVSVTDRDENGRPTEIVLYLPGLTIQCRKDGSWSVTGRQEHDYGVPVEVLRYRPRAKRRYGISRITPAAMSMQDAAVRTLIRLEGHMDVYSYPEMWLLGADEKIFKNTDGTVRTPWQVMLGRIKAIPDDDGAVNPRADVRQFQAASPTPHTSQLNIMAKAVAREFSLPDSSFALTDYANPTSADSYVEGRDDLIADAEAAMDEWSVPISRAMRRGLAMQAAEPALFDGLRSLTVQWNSPLHLSRAAAADAGAKQLASVPWLAETEVGLELLGLTDEQIKRALGERRRAAGRATVAALIDANTSG